MMAVTAAIDAERISKPWLFDSLAEIVDTRLRAFKCHTVDNKFPQRNSHIPESFPLFLPANKKPHILNGRAGSKKTRGEQTAVMEVKCM